MTAKAKKLNPGERIIVPLDVETPGAALEIIDELAGKVGAFKVGLQLFTAAGPDFVRLLVERGIRVFLDVKFHDIPNTVAKASVEVARLGVWMFNIHALGGSEMMRRTVGDVREFCERESLTPPKIIAVTILTSSDQNTLTEIGIDEEIGSEVVNLARLAAECGLDGVVASPLEVNSIRRNVDAADFQIVTPGIRPGFATNDDQRRVMTPGDALRQGSDYLVIGRPITRAADRRAAVAQIIAELEND